MSSSPEAEPEVEALAEAATDANQLSRELRREIARIVIELHRNPRRGEPMGDKPTRGSVATERATCRMKEQVLVSLSVLHFAPCPPHIDASRLCATQS